MNLNNISNVLENESYDYWKNMKLSMLDKLNINYDFVNVNQYEKKSLCFNINNKIIEKLDLITNGNELLKYSVFLTAISIQLYKYTNKNENIIGISAYTSSDSTDDTILRSSILPLKIDLNGEIKIKSLMIDLKKKVSNIYKNQYCDVNTILKNLNICDDVMDLTSINIVMDTLHSKYIDNIIKSNKNQITISIEKKENNLLFSIIYNAKLYIIESMNRFGQHYLRIVEGILNNLDKEVKDIEMISQDEKDKILCHSGERNVNYPKGRTIQELFEEQVEKTPDNIAVAFENEKLTYMELNEKANSLARTLRSKGVKSNSIVGIMVGKSLGMIVGMMAILKAGGAYLPIDPELPKDRINFMIKDSEINILVTSKELTNMLEFNGIILDITDKNMFSEKSYNAELINNGNDLAYIIYTSGTTGNPKGVMVEHNNVVRLMINDKMQFEFNDKDVWTMFHSYCFDFSVWEMYGALLYGGKLVLVSKSKARNIEEYLKILKEEKVTVLNQIPTPFYNLMNKELNCYDKKLKLRYIIFGGEALKPSMLKEWIKKYPETKLINMYGITETTVHSTFKRLTEYDMDLKISNVGTPIPTSTIYIMNKDLKIQPVGVPGEICVGGDGVARGYLNNKELTRLKFIDNPYKPEEKIYRSGDLGRILSNGEIEYLGRIDHQVKIRGFRIELAEIEDRLKKHPFVKNAVVLSKEGEEGDKYLTAYIETDKINFQTIDGEKRYILPNNMAIVHLNKNETDFMYNEIFVEQNYLKHGIRINNGDCIFDIGANIGMFTLLINQLYKDMKVFTFEPIPDLFKLLEINVGLYCNGTKAFNCGVSNENTQSVFTFYSKASVMSGRYGDLNIEKETFGKSMVNQGQMDDKGKEDIDKYYNELLEGRFESKDIVCQMKTLSEIIKENNINKIDLLKVDVEKSELDVLQGIAEEDWCKIKQIVLEVHNLDGLLNKVVSLLKKHGYKVSVDTENELEKTNMYNVYAIFMSEADKVKDYINKYKISREIPMVKDHILIKDDLRDFLLKMLPEYMIPSYFVQLEEMPLSSNCKLDRAALRELSVNMMMGIEYEAPRNEVEEKLATIYSDILGVEKIGINDNFFELGGHSLKATILASKTHKALDVELPLSVIFKSPTIKEIGEYIQGTEKNIYLSIEKVEEKEYYEASSAQKRMYMIQEFDITSTGYNIPSIMEVEGELDKKQLVNTIEKLIQRHETLRTSFELIDGKIYQNVREDVEFKLEYKEAKENEVESIVKKFIRSFDLRVAPLLRVGLIKVHSRKHILMFDMHHIISDGVSIDILINEFTKLYEEEELKELKIQYKDYSAWQNKLLKSEEMKKQEEYWVNKFSGEIPVLNMPTDYVRPIIQNFEGDRVRFNLDMELEKKLRELAKETGSTIYMVLLSGVNILFSKYSNQEDIIVGTPIAGRRHTDLDGIIGMFVNTLPMRNKPKPEKTYKEFLREVGENALQAYENQDYQFEELLDKLSIRRDVSRNPLFDVMFVMQSPDNKEISLKEISFKPYIHGNSISKFDITIIGIELEDEIYLEIEYSTKLFKKETIERIIKHLKNILKQIVSDININIGEIEILDEEEKFKLLDEFNDSFSDYPKNKTIHELFEEQVKKTPNNIAIAFKEKKITYRELNTKANQLAKHLRLQGVKSDTIVCLMLEKSIETIVGMLGILKAGGAYLSIDPTYPEDRINYIINDSKATILLTNYYLNNKGCFNDKKIFIDDETIYTGSGENLNNINVGSNLAYIIYTSGTTGNPKGVMIEHINVVSLMKNEKMQFEFYDSDIWTMFHSPCFDFSVWEIYGALLYGGKLVIIQQEIARDTEKFLEMLKTEGVTVLNQIPSAFYNLIQEEKNFEENRLNLRYVIFGGEALNPLLLREWKEKYPKTKLINMYGITETTVHVTYKELTDEDVNNNVSNIGKSIPTLTTYVMDKSLKLVPIGVVGELCVGGKGVARGYLNRPELTSERFIVNPYKQYEKIYKSGDLIKLLPNGDMEYIGRKDNQVKIRGFRIELGEIKSQILSHELVKDVVVIAKENSEGVKYLCAYIESKERVSTEELRSYLVKRIPEYMVPTYFINLDRIPITSNGKVDKYALPDPLENLELTEEYIAPTNEVQKKLIEVWEDVLGVNKIGITHNFFALGGDSIKAIQILSRLRKYGLKLEMKDVFQYATIYDLSRQIKTIEVKSQQKNISGEFKLTPIQQWFFEKDFAEINHWNQSVILFSKNRFDIDILKRVFTKIVEHHDVLRSIFNTKSKNVKASIRELGEELFDFKFVDLINYECIEKIRDKEIESIQQSINIETGPLVKLGLFRENDGDHLLIVIHHLVIDGVSWRILLEDLIVAYEQVENGQEIKLQDKTDSFIEWSKCILEFAENNGLGNEVNFWRTIESTQKTLLPKDKVSNNCMVQNTAIVKTSLSKELTENLIKHANRSYNTETIDILLAALGLTLKEWTLKDKIFVSLEGHGREGIIKGCDVTRTIGWFTSIYPFIIDASITKDMPYYIKHIKESIRRVPNKGIGYGILKYSSDIYKEYSKEFTSAPQVCFNYLGEFNQNLKTDRFEMSKLSSGNNLGGNNQRLYALDISILIYDSQIQISFNYSKEEYEQSTIEKLIGIYKEKINYIVEQCISRQEIEVTPSDLGYGVLSLEELDDIMEIYK